MSTKKPQGKAVSEIGDPSKDKLDAKKAGSVANMSDAGPKKSAPSVNNTSEAGSGSGNPADRNKFTNLKDGDHDEAQLHESLGQTIGHNNPSKDHPNAFVESMGLETQGMLQNMGGASRDGKSGKGDKLGLSELGLGDSGGMNPGQSQEMIVSLKQNLQSLESKINEIRNQRQKQKHDITSHQAKLNTELTKIVADHKAPGQEEVERVVNEEVVRRPTSLTKENIKLKQENQRLQERLLERDRELEQLANELKTIRKSRDDALDRVEELNKIVESRHAEDAVVARGANGRAAEADQAGRELRNKLLVKKAEYEEEVRKDDVQFWRTSADPDGERELPGDSSFQPMQRGNVYNMWLGKAEELAFFPGPNQPLKPKYSRLEPKSKLS